MYTAEEIWRKFRIQDHIQNLMLLMAVMMMMMMMMTIMMNVDKSDDNIDLQSEEAGKIENPEAGEQMISNFCNPEEVSKVKKWD